LPKSFSIQGFGDTRDLAVLSIALFKAAGFEDVYPVLVSPGIRIREDIPALTQFNRIVLKLTAEGKDFYLDPFAEDCPRDF
jgi:hypothetical protein